MTPKETLVSLVATLPMAWPKNADRKTMWDRISSVLKASAGSNETWGKIVEAIALRLSLDLAKWISSEAVINALTAGDMWAEIQFDEAVRLATEETTLVCALARLQWQSTKEERKKDSE